MDLKTLEYMEERVNKSRKIIGIIEDLKRNIENIKKVDVVNFNSAYSGKKFDSETGNLTNEIKLAYIKAAENEIGALEQLLAKL